MHRPALFIFFFQKVIHNFEIEHKTCLFLVRGEVPLAFKANGFYRKSSSRREREAKQTGNLAVPQPSPSRWPIISK